MSKIHHATLKSAVATYLPFLQAGSTEEEVKEEIDKDPKAFDQESVNEIYAAIVAASENSGDPGSGADEGEKDKDNEKDLGKEKKAKKKGAYIVVAPFRDIDDFSKEHKPGHDVSHFDAKRLENLMEKKLVELQA